MKPIALIPARSGSERIKDKNIKIFINHPLMAYSIRLAIESKIFSKVVVITDSKKYAKIAKYYGAEVPKLRPKNISLSNSPDILWVKWILDFYRSKNCNYKIFSILRPTSPFRKISSLKKAFNNFNNKKIHTLRAMEKTSAHPGKMWKLKDNIAYPIMPYEIDGTFWHSNQTKSLPEIYVQNASLEISYSKFVYENNSITGGVITPFFFKGYEGYDINTNDDFSYAEYLIEKDLASIIQIKL